MVVTVLLWYAMLLVFGLVRSLAAGIVVLAVTGLVQSVAMISMAGSLLRASSARFRGRVMGVRTLAVYGLPLGLMASGALVDRIGYTPTVTLYAVTGILFSALIAAPVAGPRVAGRRARPPARRLAGGVIYPVYPR